jgi:hypothetical protein
MFSDDCLSLFGLIISVAENLIYLAWAKKREPEVWVYVGLQSYRFQDLERYFGWCLKRE